MSRKIIATGKQDPRLITSSLNNEKDQTLEKEINLKFVNYVQKLAILKKIAFLIKTKIKINNYIFN